MSYGYILLVGGLFLALIMEMAQLKKKISILEDLIGGIGVSGRYQEVHGNIFSHVIVLEEKIEALAQKIDILGRTRE